MKEQKRNIIPIVGSMVCYIVIGYIVVMAVQRNGIYPSGADTMCHVYKGDVLLQEIKRGNWYPLYDAKWYNGVQMMRYWAPLPVYVLAGCQFLAMGNPIQGYLLFVAFIFLGGALSWLWIGYKKGRVWLGAFIGGLWFFMPNNLYALFMEGNLPRSICMVILPLYIFFVHEYLQENKKKYLGSIIATVVFMALCHLGYGGMIALATIVFLLLHGMLFHRWKPLADVMICIVLGFLFTGVWSYASLKGGITSTDSSQVMKSFFQDGWISLHPLLRLTDNFSHFYFGLAAFLLALFGGVCSMKKSMAGFWMALITFICTTTSMYGILVHLPGSQYLWMLRFISIALCFILYSLLLWDTLKKPFLILVCTLLVLDVFPSSFLIFGNHNNVMVEQRYQELEEETLIKKAKDITEQRMALMDLSELEATAAYLVSGYHNGVDASYGAGWQSAATAFQIVQLNQAIDDGQYLYLFDRALELGNDTVLIKISCMRGATYDIPSLDAAAERLEYQLVDENDEYRLYHRKVSGNFGVKSKYGAIGIGSSAPQMSIYFPDIEETRSTNINDYTFEQLSGYETIYLAGFTYTDKEKAEELLKKVSDEGTRIVILADGIPMDEETSSQTFLGVDCYQIKFYSSYPTLDTIKGTLVCDMFPEEHKDWKTVYMNGLDHVWGKLEDLDKTLAFCGTKYNDNIVFLGLNMTYHYALTKDFSVGDFLAYVLDIKGDALPTRKLVPLDIRQGKNKIEIISPEKDVNTTLAFHDNFESENHIYEKRNLTYVGQGKTEITMHYPYLWEGLLVTGIAAVITALFLRRKKKEE